MTFTYGGVKTNTNAQVLGTNDVPIPGLWAAGEMTGLFYNGKKSDQCGVYNTDHNRISTGHLSAAVPHFRTPCRNTDCAQIEEGRSWEPEVKCFLFYYFKALMHSGGWNCDVICFAHGIIRKLTISFMAIASYLTRNGNRRIFL